MIAEMALSVMALSIWSEDKDFDELFQRAVLLNDRSVFLDAFPSDKMDDLKQSIDDWILNSKNIEEMATKAKTFHFLFPNDSVLSKFGKQISFKQGDLDICFIQLNSDLSSTQIRTVKKWIKSKNKQVIDLGEEYLVDGALDTILDSVFDGRFPRSNVAHDGLKVLVEFESWVSSSVSIYSTDLVEIPKGEGVKKRHESILEQIEEIYNE